MLTASLIFTIIILIMSIVIHEVSHGYAAYMLGDHTAEYEGRLTLNPLKHLDPVGSVLVPIFLYMTTGFAFGWAKPVPYNPYNLRNQKWGEAWVAIAGPLSNITLAILCGLVIRFSSSLALGPAFFQLLATATLINIVLAVFNLVPVPPLDGSKILFMFFPLSWMGARVWIERYGFVVTLFFIFFIWQFFFPVITTIFTLITGLS